MTPTNLLISNFTEVRKKSIQIWQALPEQYFNWKPDAQAMCATEMIRHILEADYGWNIIINQGDMKNYKTPWENRPFVNLQDELEFAAPYRKVFLESVRKFTPQELKETLIIHPGNGAKKVLGKYLLRIAYHESVHAGQFLSYLRAMHVHRPDIWT